MAAEYGPWNAELLQGGIGLEKPLPEQAPVVSADADWSAHGWIRAERIDASRVLLAGFGDPLADARYFVPDNGRLGFWWGDGQMLSSSAHLQPARWHFIAAIAQGGRLSLFLDGRRVATGDARRKAVGGGD